MRCCYRECSVKHQHGTSTRALPKALGIVSRIATKHCHQAEQAKPTYLSYPQQLGATKDAFLSPIALHREHVSTEA